MLVTSFPEVVASSLPSGEITMDETNETSVVLFLMVTILIPEVGN